MTDAGVEEEEDGDGAALLPTEEGFFRLGQMEDFVQQAEELYEKERMAEGRSSEGARPGDRIVCFLSKVR